MDARAGDPAPRLDAQKKSLGAAERDEEQRQAYRERLAGRDAAEFVVVDECGTNLNLTPTYGRAPRGQRAVGIVPRNTPPNTTLIASLTTAGMGPALLLDGATDALTFEAYVEHVLAPALRPGQVVVLDNLSAHKGDRVRALVEARGCRVWSLPPYSPDLSPIEEAFAKLKTLLRRAAARSREALDPAIAHALDQISPADARGYFAHCGYPVSAQ
jgi:transposase